MFLAGCLSLLTACSTVRVSDMVIGPSYQPSNVYRVNALPANLRRVAVLPLTANPGDDLAAGREILEPILHEELAKTKKFELVLITPQALRQRTGQASWRADEKLPADFFSTLTNAYGCDAVLFCHLTVFRAYPPLAVGWRFKLVECRDAQTIWAADDVFDAGQPAVVNGARRYEQDQQQNTTPQLDSRRILNAPRRFGHYAASTLLATMPDR